MRRGGVFGYGLYGRDRRFAGACEFFRALGLLTGGLLLGGFFAVQLLQEELCWTFRSGFADSGG